MSASPGPRDVRRPRRRSGPGPGGVPRLHWIVWFVLALHVSFGLLFSLLVPAFRAPDEANHLDMLRRYRVELGHDAPDRLVRQGLDVATADASVAPPTQEPRPALRAADAPPRPDRPTFAELAPAGAASDVPNNMSQHPPTYYAVVAGATTALAGFLPVDAWSWDRELHLYRVVSVVLTAPIPVLAAMAARAVRLSPLAGAGAAAATLLVPQATAIGAAVNNDALLMVAAAAAVALSLDHLGTGRPGTAWAAMAAAVVAALTKSTAAVIPVWVLVVVLVSWWGRRNGSREGGTDPAPRSRAAGWSALAGSVAISAVGASWYLANIVRFGRPQPSGMPRRTNPDVDPDLGWFLPRWIDRLTRSFWGMPARRTGVSLPWPVAHGLSAGVVVVGVAALFDRRRRRASVLLLLLVVVQVLLVAQTNWRAHVRLDGLPGVQGRYLFALLVPLAVLAVVGARQLWRLLVWAVPGLGRTSWGDIGAEAAVWAVVLAGSTLHAMLSWSMLDGFWGEPGSGVGDALAAVVAWSPLPAALTRSVVAAAVVLSLVGPVRTALLALRRPVAQSASGTA